MTVDARGSGSPTAPLARVSDRAPGGGGSATIVFAGVELEIGSGALVPRSETELLAEVARDFLRECDTPRPLVIDMCCGVGNLACALALSRPDAELHACDLTAETVALAERNAARLGLGGRLTVHRGDLFAALAGLGLERRAALVVANPPYISSARLDGEAAALLEREPREAFDGGPYGLSVHQRLIREARAFLIPGGMLAFEFGNGQHLQVDRLLRRAGGWREIRLVGDAAGIPRVGVALTAGDTGGAR